MAECEDDWANAPCLRPLDRNFYPTRDVGPCMRCGWHLDAHQPFYVRWWRRLTMVGTRGHGRA